MSENKFPVRTLLFVSLAVNLLVIGAGVGVFAAGARLHRPTPPPPLGPPGFMRAIPQEQAPEVRQKLAEAWGKADDEREAARLARQALWTAVNKPSFDEAGVRAALAKLRAADNALAARNQEAVVAVLKDLTPEQRRRAIGALLRVGAAARAAPPMGPPSPGMAAPPSGERLREWRERRRDRLEERRERQPPQ